MRDKQVNTIVNMILLCFILISIQLTVLSLCIVEAIRRLSVTIVVTR